MLISLSCSEEAMRFSLGANAKPRGFPMSAKSARESVVVQSPANNLRSRTPPCRSLKPNLLDRCELGAGRPHPNVRLAAGRLRAAVREGEAESLEFPPREESEVAADDPAEAEAAVVLQDMARFLPADLKRFLATGNLTKARYSPSMSFTDPVTKIEGYGAFKALMDATRFFFKASFEVHSVEITGPANITTKWAMYLKQEQLPWQPSVVLTGKTFYTIDIEKKQVLSHVDEWDSASHNTFFSVDALADMMGQVLKVNMTPGLETPEYSVLRRTKEYEIRKYKPFVVAETEMSPGSGPAGGSGFGDLAGFLFGGNDKGLSMDMTTPVISTASQAGDSGNKMQFVMSSRFQAPGDLPRPNSTKVQCKTSDPGVVGALEFTGWPVDYEVVQAEDRLRKMLIAEGFNPLPGYQLARYNDPGTLPMLRRNEVLIQLEDMQL